MWIHHIGEIMVGVFSFLILVHFGLHFFFKFQKRKIKRQKLAVTIDDDLKSKPR